MPGGDGRALERHAVLAHERPELIERELRRPGRAEDEHVRLGELRRHRLDVDRLQQLRLPERVDARDLMARARRVEVGEQPLRRIVARVAHRGAPAVQQRELLEAEVAVEAAEPAAAQRRVVAETKARAE